MSIAVRCVSPWAATTSERGGPHVRFPRAARSGHETCFFRGNPPHNKRHFAGMIGKVQSRLTGRVSGTDGGRGRVREWRLPRCAPHQIQALPDQPVEALDRQATPRHARGENDGPGPNEVVAIEENLTRRRIDSGLTERVTSISAPRRFACWSARLASSSPETPLGKPR